MLRALAGIPPTTVLGPAAGGSTDNAVVRWDGATGKLVQNSLGIVNDNGDLSLGLSGQTFGASTGSALTLQGWSRFKIQTDASQAGQGNVDFVMGTQTMWATGLNGVTASGGLVIPRDGVFAWATAANNIGVSPGALDLYLVRDAANTLALRNGTTAQAFNVYQSWVDASNNSGIQLSAISGNRIKLETFANGSGTAQSLIIGTTGANSITFFTAAANRWDITNAGHLIADTDNAYDIGASGATRPRNVYVAGNYIGSGTFVTAGVVQFGNSVVAPYIRFDPQASGKLLFMAGDGGAGAILQFGGITSSFPALKRSTTILQARLADDSDFAPLQGKLRTQANAVAETPTATHTMIITDAGGTAYRVLCCV